MMDDRQKDIEELGESVDFFLEDSSSEESSTFSAKAQRDKFLTGSSADRPSRRDRYEAYNARPDKRFILSNEEFAKKRIEGVKTAVADIKSKYPNVLSFCMFGSMVKGAALPDSDIDGWLYIDVSKDTEDGLVIDLVENGRIQSSKLTEDQATKYIEPFKEVVKSNTDLSTEQVEHVRSLPISQAIIDKHVANLVDMIHGDEEYDRARDQRRDEFLKRNPLGSFYESRPDSIPLPLSSTNLSAMFHLEVGKGIDRYREYLINKLSDMGDVGEKAWSQIIRGTEAFEQNLQTNTDKRYPRTLHDAKVSYGSNVSLSVQS